MCTKLQTTLLEPFRFLQYLEVVRLYQSLASSFAKNHLGVTPSAKIRTDAAQRPLNLAAIPAVTRDELLNIFSRIGDNKAGWHGICLLSYSKYPYRRGYFPHRGNDKSYSI